MFKQRLIWLVLGLVSLGGADIAVGDTLSSSPAQFGLLFISLLGMGGAVAGLFRSFRRRRGRRYTRRRDLVS